MDLRAARSALYIHRRDDARPVEGEREARELVERAVLRVGRAEELCAGHRPARVREVAVRGWMGESGRDGRC